MKTLITSIVLLLAVTANAQLKPVKEGVYKWNELQINKSEKGEPRKLLEGVSPHFEYLEIYATTQLPGAKPSKSTANKAMETCIIVKEGLMKVTIEGKSDTMGAGGVVLVMPQEAHTIENVGNTNLTYYVMRYKSKKPMVIERGIANGGSMVFNPDSLVFKPSARGGGIAYFDRPTAMCERFEMHITQLDKQGPSHNPHTHIESEIMLVIAGNTEMTINGNVYGGTAGDMFFVNSQLMHGIRNAGKIPCKYFAFKWK